MLNKPAYLFSRILVNFASSLFSMTFIWWLQTTSHKSTLVGLAEGIFSLIAALSIFYGPIIDYLSFKQIGIYSMLIQTVALFLISGVMNISHKNYLVAIAIAAIISVCNNFFDPADRAILKETTTNAEMTDLISKVSIIDQGVNIAGTLLSGLLLAVFLSKEIVAACGVFTLIGVVLLIKSLKKVSSISKSETIKLTDIGQIFSGYKFIRKNNFLNLYFWSSILYSFTTPAMIVLLPKVANSFNSNILYSVFYGCFIIGFIGGAIIAGKLRPSIKVISISWAASAFPLLIMLVFIRNWLLFSIAILAFGILTSLHNILSESLIQIISADKILGRVLTTIKTSTSLGGPIGSIVAGELLDHSGEAIVIIACSVLIFLSGMNIFRAKN